MRLIDYGAWTRSWSGYDRKAEKRLNRHGWKRGGKKDDLIDYGNGERIIRLSRFGYMLLEDDMPDEQVEELARLLAPIWRHGNGRHTAYPMTGRIGSMPELAVTLRSDMLAQTRIWLSHPVEAGRSNAIDRLNIRIREVECLHPAPKKEWDDGWRPLSDQLDLLRREAEREREASGLSATLKILASTITPLAALMLGAGFQGNTILLAAGIGISGLACILTVIGGMNEWWR